MKKIVLTGGGTSGHVTPNIALIPGLRRAGYTIFYIGSVNGMERQLIEKEGLPYYSISAGKLRRYFDKKNFSDVFRVLNGLRQSFFLLGKLKPSVVFSKGGFVSCPVVWAAWLRRIPVVIHESDITPGLTNKLSMPFAKKVCYTFPETKDHIPSQKAIRTGIPIRESLFKGSSSKGKEICGFKGTKPVIMVIGGSQGSEKINGLVRAALDELLPQFDICHICGKGNIKKELLKKQGYKQFEYVNKELPHLFAIADLIVSRAGATALFEFLALKKPNLLIPLPKSTSRGDQLLNAASFERQGFSMVIQEDNLDEKELIKAIYLLFSSKDKYRSTMKKYSEEIGVNAVISVLNDLD